MWCPGDPGGNRVKPDRPVPKALGHHFAPEDRRENHGDLLRVASREALVVVIAAEKVANGAPLSEADRGRIVPAVSLLLEIADAA